MIKPDSTSHWKLVQFLCQMFLYRYNLCSQFLDHGNEIDQKWPSTAPSGFVRWKISHVSLVCAGCSNFTRKSQHGGEGKGSCSRRWFSLDQCNFFCSSCRRPLDREISLPRRMCVRIYVFVPNVRTGLHGWVHLQEGNTCVKNSIWEDLDSSSLYHSVPGYVRDHLFVESKILKQKEQSFEPFSFLSNNILHFLCPGTFQ